MPVEESACKIPIEALELWIIAVSTTPAKIPKIGLLKSVRKPVKLGSFASGATASLIISIPNIKIAKPIKIPPISFFF